MANTEDRGGSVDPEIASLLGNLGIDPGQINPGGMPGGAVAQQPLTLTEMLLGTAMEVTGAYSQRGTRRSPVDLLPPWAQGLPAEVVSHPDFDPYMGIVSQEGDERVYLGQKANRNALTVFVGDMFNFDSMSGDVSYEDANDPADTRKNKVERQLGNNPDDQVKYETKSRDLTKPKTQTVTQVMNLPYLWDEDQVTDAMKRMRQAGLPVTTFEQLNQVWSSLVDRAAKTYSLSSGKKLVTPWDVLELHKKEATAAGNFTNFENGSRTTVNRSVTEITEGQAWSALQGQLSQMLGRDPSDQEMRDFAYRMNHLAAKNPTISETITRYKAGEEVSSETETSGGFDGGDMVQAAYEDAQAEPDYAEYQSGTTYFNAALSALAAIGVE